MTSWSQTKFRPCERQLTLAWCSQGLVEAVGVSNYGPKQLQRIHKNLTARGVPLASVQVSLPLSHRSPGWMGLSGTCKPACLQLSCMTAPVAAFEMLHVSEPGVSLSMPTKS